jgi:hypothetical protein
MKRKALKRYWRWRSETKPEKRSIDSSAGGPVGYPRGLFNWRLETFGLNGEYGALGLFQDRFGGVADYQTRNANTPDCAHHD